MKNESPVWDIPKNIEEIVADVDTWEDDRWKPVLLTIMGGTSYKGREIPLAWQIEFEPCGEEFEAPNRKIEMLGADPDGYGWANVVHSVVGKHHPEIVNELQFGDTDENACVVWVESERTCKILMQVVWELIHGA